MNTTILETCRWPGAFVISTVVFFLIFRKPISDLIGRIRSIGRNGIQTAADLPQTTEKKSAEELMRVFDSVVLREQEDLIDKDIDAKGLTDPRDIRKVLVRHLAAVMLSFRFEFIDRYIYGSQIRLLEYLNSKPGEASVEELQFFYNEAVERYPSLYEKYSFDSYVNFLSSFTLIGRKEGRYFVTNFGRDFLSFLTRAGKPFVRFG